MTKTKVFIIVDMQNDFITGQLANPEGQALVGNLKAEIEKKKSEGYKILFTQDTHDTHYLESQEGKYLPVPHCIEGTEGWEIIPELRAYTNDHNVLIKKAFGCSEIGQWVAEAAGGEPEEIVIAGVCTDICVISNAMILKAFFPEVPIKVMGNLCAGVTKDSHRIALEAMKPCQIEIV